MDQKDVIYEVLQKKCFRSYKLISRGSFSATIDLQRRGVKRSILLITKNELKSRKFELEKLQNKHTVQVLNYGYLIPYQTYLIRTNSGEILQDRVKNEEFKRSPVAIQILCQWITEVALGLTEIHAKGYNHLNVCSTTVIIDKDNSAKIGGFDYARHYSTVNERIEYGSASYCQPPEIFGKLCGATDGEKYDVWCLAIMTIEVLTDHYIARKSYNITTWPKLYPIIYKILQAKKFKKTVKKTYHTSGKGQQLKEILRLVKHTLKFETHERPKMFEFSELIMEHMCAKNIKYNLTEEKIWMRKVPLAEVELKMAVMAINNSRKMSKENKPRCAGKLPKKTYGEEIENQLSLREKDQVERDMLHHQSLQKNLSKNNETDFSFHTEDKRKDKKITITFDEGLQKNKDITLQDQYDNEVPNNDFIKTTDEKMLFSKEDKANFGQSDIFIPGQITSIKKITEEGKEAKGGLAFETPVMPPVKAINQNNADNSERSHYSVKKVLHRVVNWVFDEVFYTGVMNQGSFISKLSKTLTG